MEIIRSDKKAHWWTILSREVNSDVNLDEKHKQGTLRSIVFMDVYLCCSSTTKILVFK